MKRYGGIFLVGALVIIGLFAYPKVTNRMERQKLIREQEAVELPAPEVLEKSSSMPFVQPSLKPEAASSSLKPEAASFSSLLRDEGKIRSKVNWDVPFTSQAPTGEWDELHGEACEEASVAMVIRYFENNPFDSVEDREETIQFLVKKNEELGLTIDDTAAETEVLLKSVAPSLHTSLLKDPTVDQLKGLLADGALIIIPAQGQFLKNPYYRQPGPRYHMLVLRGYTEDGYVITNDPGTRNGEAYVYPWDRLMNAMHDWNGGDVENGQKVVLVVRSGR